MAAQPERRPRRDRSITAAGVRLPTPTENGGVSQSRQRSDDAWKKEAWACYHSVGEVKFATRFRAHSLARLRLFPAIRVTAADDPMPLADAARLTGDGSDPDDPAAPLTAEDAQAIDAEFDRLSHTPGGMAELQRSYGVHMTIPGETNLVGWDDQVVGGERWAMLPETCVKGGDRDGVYTVNHPDTGEAFDIDASAGGPDFAARLWLRDEERPWKSDSNLRSALDIVEELLIYQRSLRGTGRSRAPAGLLLLPNELDLAPVSVVEEDDDDPDNVIVLNPDESADEFTEFERGIVQSFTAPTQDDGSAASVAPHIIRGAADALKEVRHVSLARDIDPQVLARIEHLIGRLAHALDVPVEVIEGMGDSNHWCVDEQTRAFTPDGWKSLDEIEVGMTVLSLDHETGVATWAEIVDLYVAEVDDEPMVTIEMVGHSSLTTPNHRWPVVSRAGLRQWATSETLRDGQHIATGLPCIDQPTEQKWSDEIVELLAWYWTEGSEVAVKGACIAQSHTANPERTDRIRALLTRFYGPSQVSLRGSRGPAWREDIRPNVSSHGGPVTVFSLNAEAAVPLRSIAPGKVVPVALMREFTPAQLLLFIDVSLQGDGWHYRGGRWDIYQKNPAMLDAIEAAAILAGLSVSRRPAQAGECLCISRKATVRPVKAARAATRENRPGGAQMAATSYTGRVWCPVTTTGTWLAGRNGTAYYTGNSAWFIDDQTYKSHVEPLAQMLADDLARVFLRPAILDAGIDPQLAREVVIGIDPAGLVVRPNRVADATTAYEKFELSGDALRRYMNFSDRDAPDEEEIAKRVEIAAALHARAAVEAPPGAEAPTTAQPNPPAPEEGPGPSGGDSSPSDRSGGPQGGGDAVPASGALLAAGGQITDLGARLAGIDQRLAARIQTAASAAMSAVLARAGARLRAAVQGDPTLAGQLRGVPNAEVGAVVGPGHVSGELVTAQDFDDLHRQFIDWTGQARAQAVAAVRAEAERRDLDVEAVDAAVGDIQRTLPHDQAAGWSVLLSSLLALGRDRVYSPDATPDRGEFDPHLSVPMGSVRRALGTLGDGGLAGPDGPGSSSGPATGASMMNLGVLAAIGASTVAYQWTSGSSDRPFPPHADLDGLVVSGPDDPQLQSDEWPADGGLLQVGDHPGCSCSLDPIIVIGAALSDGEGD